MAHRSRLTMRCMTLTSAQGLDQQFWDDVDRHVVRYNPAFVPVVVDRAEGSWLHTSDGRRLLDFTSGQMSAILGHSHPAIVATLRDAAGTLDHLFSAMLSRPVVDLSRRLAESLPAPLEKTLLLSTGAESNEAALRMAKLVTGRYEVVSFNRSWHGMTQAAVGATYSAGRRGYGPPAPGNFALPTPDAYRPDVTGPDGGFDWRRQLDLGFAMIDAQSIGQPRGLHRRADPVQRGRDRPAARLPRRAARPLPRARHAAHLRRGADGPVPHGRRLRLRARRRGARHPHAVQDAGSRPPALRRRDERRDRAARLRRAGTSSSPRTCPTRSSRRSA